MTDRPEIDPALVEAGARAIAAWEGCYGRQTNAYCGDSMDDNCVCGETARVVIEAILPMVREECAKIAKGERDRQVAQGHAQRAVVADNIASAIRNHTTGE